MPEHVTPRPRPQALFRCRLCGGSLADRISDVCDPCAWTARRNDADVLRDRLTDFVIDAVETRFDLGTAMAGPTRRVERRLPTGTHEEITIRLENGTAVKIEIRTEVE